MAFSRTTEQFELVNSLLKDEALPSDRANQLDGLILTDINRHGISLTWRAKIITGWTWEISSQTGYAFAQSIHDYSFALSTRYRIRKSWELDLHTAYFNSGSGSNQGSDVREVAVALKTYF